ncbi:acyl dehydratase [Silicimonas algicola]|uniref:Acyl dehydratase n=1 Tax=Silicimonas algicola TaxID=1826607 RepID=A0A316FXV5_9RHOB|nr:acyl dehydratase [Silicimonas algicola]AZQ68336.1 acyl dehydratase [Silicimonas algicola]PWK53594.1 hypothetical protein C8D95_113119 [Silicimonas algicola]
MQFESVIVGQELPEVVKGPMSVGHIVRWSAAMENWHRIHFDWRYATEHDGLPDVLVNGSWKQHVLMQLLSDWVGEDGWVWRISFQYRGMNIPGDTLTAWGRVTGTEVAGAYGVVRLEIGMKDQNGIEGSPGEASVVIRRENGPAVPYPFDAACLGRATA